MVYPSIRGDSQGCPTKAEGRTMAKQCWESRPNPSGQPREPCSHGLLRQQRPTAPPFHWGARPTRLKLRPARFNQTASHTGFSPGPPQRPKQERPPHVPFPSAKRAPGGVQTPPTPQLPNKPTAPQRTQIKPLTTPIPERRAKSTPPRPPAKVPKSGVPWDILGHLLPQLNLKPAVCFEGPREPG